MKLFGSLLSVITQLILIHIPDQMKLCPLMTKFVHFRISKKRNRRFGCIFHSVKLADFIKLQGIHHQDEFFLV